MTKRRDTMAAANRNSGASAFAETFSISGRAVGGGARVFVIAEAGVAHFGDAGKAAALVDLAAEAGADAFKTQAFSTEALVSSRLPEWRERLKPKEVGFDFIARMKARCDERGIVFLCTAHDETVLPWLDALQVPAFKIGSGERGNAPFLSAIAARGKPIILSTGMYGMGDVTDALAALSRGGCREAALLHCVTSYPTPYDQVNLRAMEALRRVFPGPVGYSDHTGGGHAVLAAVALGAGIVEKHITLDFNVPNAQDWKVAAGPETFPALVRAIREVEAALGTAEKIPQPCEESGMHWALKSLVAARDLAAGTVLDAGMLAAKRPGGGIAPARLGDVIGRRLCRALSADDAVSWDDLQS